MSSNELDRAESLIREAESIIRGEVKGTPYARMAEERVLRRLDECVTSVEDPTSLRNLRKNLSISREDRLWTKPYGSPKYP